MGEISMRGLETQNIKYFQDGWNFKEIKINGSQTTGNLFERMPLTSTQKSIWATQQLYPDSSICNIGGYSIFNTSIKIEVLAKVFEQIFREHDVFSMEFIEDDFEVFQQVKANCQYTILYSDEIKSEEEILEYINNDMQYPFDFSGQLFKFTILKASEKRYYVFFKANHIISDGYSISILIQRLCELYEGYINDENAISCEVTTVNTYSSLVAHEAKYKTSKKYNADRNFWLELMQEDCSKGFENCITAGSKEGHLTDRKGVILPRAAYNEMIEFSTEQNSTIYHYFIAAIYALNKLYGNELFVLGLPVLNRSTSEHKKTIGTFISVIPFRPANNKFDTFEELMSDIKNSVLSCYRHQKYPMYDLTIDLNRTGLLYNICFSYQRTEYPETLDGEPCSTVYINNKNQQEDIVIHLIENVKNDTEDAIIYFDYKKSTVSEAVINKIMEHFVYLLTSLYKNAQSGLSTIEFMSESEKNEILCNFNKTEAAFPNDKCMHGIFEEQVQRNPENIAVVYKEKSLTYMELNSMGDKLASFLQGEGVGPDKLVGICMERSIEMVLAIIAIMKAGGAYVPLDPEYPEDRLNYMIEDSDPLVILSQSHIEDKLKCFKNKTVYLDTEWERIEKNSTGYVKKAVSPENWAYMIYTSGSTGRPKGAINTHTGLVNRVNWMQKELKLEEKDAVLQKTPFSFDVSVWEFVWPLSVGARIVMAEPGGHRDPVYLTETICQYNITTLHFVPSMLRVFLSESSVSLCKSLKRIICSGEELKVDLQNECLRKLDVELYNLYGPTEAAIDVSYWKCRPDERLNSVPIGKPIDNTELLILSKDLKLLPVGVAGELHIAGAGLAVGYHNKPELTLQKFISNPYSRHGYGRMYKTGDLARWLSDGNIEYLGRIDFQVKINGLRIELGEIENRLTCIEGINEAVVTVQEDINTNKYLCAYLVGEREFSVSELRRLLAEHIPEYMIPSCFVQLEALPLSPNGKINRRLLPEPEKDSIGSREIVKPRNEKEEVLLSAAKKLLNNENMGITDNFYEFGGDSIKAIQLATKLNGMGFVIRPTDICSRSTFEEIAASLRMNNKNSTDQKPCQGFLDSTPIASWFIEEAFEERGYWNQSVLLRVDTSITVEYIEDSINEIIRHHDTLRINYNSREGKLFYNSKHLDDRQIVRTFDLPDMDFAEQKIRIREIAQEFKAGFDIEKDILFKACIFDLGNGELRLLLTAHHLVVDGVSWRIILDDINSLLHQRIQKSKFKLPYKSSSLSTWTEELRRYGTSVTEEMEYWNQVIVNQIEYDIDFDLGMDTFEHSSELTEELSEEETQVFLKIPYEVYSTDTNEMLIIALSLAISKLTGKEALSLELERHGREEISNEVDVSRTVGWFTSMYPVNLSTTGDNLNSQIKSLKEQLRGVLNKGFNFGVLKYISRMLIPDNKKLIRFNYLGDFDNTLNGSLLQAASEDIGSEYGMQNHMTCLIEVNCMVINKRLKISVTYSKNKFMKSSMLFFIKEFTDQIRELVNYCCYKDEIELTPSDFEELDISQDDLEFLFQ
jgi:amino acid adenylation domain-containing protein/non-ribosomal peptide synthase protein (TIGR01720 family)